MQTNMRRVGVRACVSSPELKDSRIQNPCRLPLWSRPSFPFQFQLRLWVQRLPPRIATLLVVWAAEGVAVPVMFAELEGSMNRGSVVDRVWGLCQTGLVDQFLFSARLHERLHRGCRAV